MIPTVVTFFDNAAARRKREERLSLHDLADRIRRTTAAEKSALPWLKLARFGDNRTKKGSLRHDANLEAIFGIEADYDGGDVALGEAVAAIRRAGLTAIVYTSPSYTPEKPRWRVVCPTAEHLPPPARGKLLDRINGVVGGVLAGESWTLSQSYYFGSVAGNPEHRVELIEGRYIDQAAELDAIAIPKGGTRGNGADRGAAGARYRADDDHTLLERIKTGETYHNTAMTLLGRWARAGLPMIEAERRLRAAFDCVLPPDRDARWRERVRQIPEWLAFVYGKDAEKAAAGRHGPIEVYDAADIDVKRIPPRGWLLGVTFCRTFISGLIGGGAVGKTSVRYAQYVALACGKPITGEAVHRRSRILVCCFEDDVKEVRRRIGATMLYHGIDPEQVRGRLFYCCPKGLKLLKTEAKENRITGELCAELERLIPELQIDVLSIDPFIKAHGVDENDNNAIDQVCDMLAELAGRFDIAVDLMSHARKGGVTPGDAESDRGASAKKDAGRLMRTLAPMSEAEASTFGIDEKDRAGLVRVDDAKVNLTVRSAEAMWFKLVGLPLGNGTADYPMGDVVQTVERWEPPDNFAGLGNAICNTIIDEIDAGLLNGRRYSDANNATERAAWKVIVKRLERTEKQARAMIKAWVKNEVLLKEDYEDPAERKTLKGLRANPVKRPGREVRY
jgi:hypothetical protein